MRKPKYLRYRRYLKLTKEFLIILGILLLLAKQL